MTDGGGHERGATAAVRLPRLRELRQAAFLTQEQLAEQSGVSRFTIRRIEGGEPARFGTLHKLAAALRVAPAELAREPQPGQLLAA